MASDLETVVDLLYLLVYLIQAVDNTVPSRPKPTKVTPLGLCFNSAPLIETAEFVGRNTEIENIHAVLRPDEARKEQKRVVLGGIGGIGKTQLAIAYARQYQQSYTSVLWLNAASESTLYASLLPVAQAISAEQTDLSTNEQVLAGVLKWLNRPDNARWLLVFDNYDEPDLFAINDFCPSVGHGSIIVTTRLPDLAKGKIVRVQPLQSIEDSLSILEIRSGRSGIQEDSSAKRLARRLSGFPLALVTAGAFLRKSTMTFEQYLDVYERKWNINPRRPLRLQDYQDRTLYTTWNLSYNRLRNEDPDAAQMLRLMAYFDNQNVWYDLLTAGLMDDLPEWLQTTLEDKTDFEGAMAVLVDYCLLEVQHTSQSYSMHSCVHDWTLSELNTTMSPELYWYAFNCVAKIIKNVDRDLFGYVKYNYVSRHARRLTHPRFETCDELEAGIVGREDKAMDIAQMLKEQVQLSAAEQIPHLDAHRGL
ncbi:hypothetical protein OHC33_011039 [Knufia fluminis]|uniref:NB-ARC domain-containing protein n=1 Tax=Knufia fluminis TaxID=191047 RepID=A0AAN8E7I9_9EURO|nr:hypothetical protein OHC33_011039 [Knufia fluminis]